MTAFLGAGVRAPTPGLSLRKLWAPQVLWGRRGLRYAVVAPEGAQLGCLLVPGDGSWRARPSGSLL